MMQVLDNAHISKEEKNWAMFAHLSVLIGFVIPLVQYLGPLIIWLMKKDEMPFASEQAKECLNFQISMTIYFFVAGMLIFAFIGIIVVPVLLVLNVTFAVRAAIKASDGIVYRYPMIIRFFS